MTTRTLPPAAPAEITREYGPFADASAVGGVTYDGERAWFAGGTHLQSFDLTSGAPGQRYEIAADAGTAFDGKHLYQLTGTVIQKLDAKTGKLLGSIPSPGQGRDSGLAWAEGKLWVGQYRDRKVHCIDPVSGKILRTIESDRFVTGVTWIDGELWHGTQEDDESEIRRIEPESGAVLERLSMPRGTIVSGLEGAGADLFLCGGGKSGKVRAVRRPRRR